MIYQETEFLSAKFPRKLTSRTKEKGVREFALAMSNTDPFL